VVHRRADGRVGEELTAWLDGQADALARFARASVRDRGGFWWLDDRGRPDPAQPLHAWITCRMTHVFALEVLRGRGAGSGAGGNAADPAAAVDHGIAALRGLLRDDRYRGWFASVAADGTPVDDGKAAYPHSFVVLAASSATVAGRPGADDLLDEALGVVRRWFWDEDAGRTVESWDRAFTVSEPYRGANSSMHMVEAFLAAGDATGDPAWAARALRICEHLVHRVAAGYSWRLPEHFTPDWRPLPEYNADRVADPFRPYGTTVGHWLEWSRLLLHVAAAVPDPPGWLLDDARALFGAAVERGWSVDGAEGFVYTLGWDDRPVVRSRMHWVVAEAIAAAAALHRRTGEASYDRWYRTFWDYARRYLIDPVDGSWRHELDAANAPAATVWQGRPDVYHAYQAALLPGLPLAGSAAGALAGYRASQVASPAERRID
jgi:mannose/cellobiose epimerase-like protein (N-acyl-D-glucosamine 2-epimerase family)